MCGYDPNFQRLYTENTWGECAGMGGVGIQLAHTWTHTTSQCSFRNGPSQVCTFFSLFSMQSAMELSSFSVAFSTT